MAHIRLTRIREDGKPNAILLPIKNLAIYINDDYETVVLNGRDEWHVEESFEDVVRMIDHVDGAFFSASNERKENAPITKNQTINS